MVISEKSELLDYLYPFVCRVLPLNHACQLAFEAWRRGGPLVAQPERAAAAYQSFEKLSAKQKKNL